MSDSSDSPAKGLKSLSSNSAMLLGLAGGYGLFGWMALRFLFPARPQDTAWLFVAETGTLAPGDSLLFRTPDGATVNVTRQGSSGDVGDFIALSSVCPHLGCQVNWEAQNERYFCPCHNGTFDASGKGTGGPPGDAGQSLGRYPLRVDAGLLFLEAPTQSLVADGGGEIIEAIDGVRGPGHDPCLTHLRVSGDRA